MARINGVDIQTVSFGVDQVEIVYAEERDLESKSGVIEYRTIVLPASLVADQVADALDSISQLIDAAQIMKRNPAAVL